MSEVTVVILVKGVGFLNYSCFSFRLIFLKSPCFGTDNSDRAFYKELVKVIEASDVILEVLDARDPLGSRCVDMEKMVMRSGPEKHLVLLLNKIGSPYFACYSLRFSGNINGF